MISRSLLVWILFAFAAANNYEDLIVAVGDRIEILTNNGSQSHPLMLQSYNASVLVALAYDPSEQKLFFSDKRNRRGHVFSVNFDGIKAEGPVHDVVERGRNESVEALSYDHMGKTLFWTDGLKQSIRRVVVDRDELHVNENSTIEVVHLLDGDKPRGLVSDPCTRMLFWTNWNIDRPTIERSYLNGSHRQIIIKEGLFMPHGLGLDVNQQMIYWANNLRHATFQIERSRVDGSERQVMYEGKGHEMRGQFIFGLTVGEHYIYWTDWDQKTLWSMRKEGFVEPIALRRYQHKPMAVIVFQRHPISCAIASTTTTTEPNYSEKLTTIETDHPQEMTTIEELFTSLSDDQLCAGYCFNDGHCFLVNSEMSCRCLDSYSGDRCEIPKTAQNVSQYCDGGFIPNEINDMFIALIAMSGVCGALLIVVIVLSARVWRLSSSRRFKRRVIRQDKHFRPAERVINIEDCCNMNICETPCTEPPSGATLPGQSSDRVKLLNCQF